MDISIYSSENVTELAKAMLHGSAGIVSCGEGCRESVCEE